MRIREICKRYIANLHRKKFIIRNSLWESKRKLILMMMRIRPIYLLQMKLKNKKVKRRRKKKINL